MYVSCATAHRKCAHTSVDDECDRSWFTACLRKKILLGIRLLVALENSYTTDHAV
jgi:hypothetical protein